MARGFRSIATTPEIAQSARPARHRSIALTSATGLFGRAALSQTAMNLMGYSRYSHAWRTTCWSRSAQGKTTMGPRLVPRGVPIPAPPKAHHFVYRVVTKGPLTEFCVQYE